MKRYAILTVVNIVIDKGCLMIKQIKLKALNLMICVATILTPAAATQAQKLSQGNFAVADYDYTTHSQARSPGAIAMGADILIARPLLLAATVIGTGLFVISLPLSILGNNVSEAGEKLVAVPAKATFFRCLGCSMSE